MGVYALSKARFDGTIRWKVQHNWAMMAIFWLMSLIFVAQTIASPLSIPTGARPWRGSKELYQALHGSSVGSEAKCFAPDQHDIDLKPIYYPDCVKAAARTTMGGKAGAPMHFSRHPNVGMQLPEHWTYGSCTIRIDMNYANEEDTFPMLVVANAASYIAERCSKPDTPGLGGMGEIGPKKVVTIFVYGRYPPPPPRPRPTIPAGAVTS